MLRTSGEASWHASVKSRASARWSGNNVSHANNKTKRRFLPNLQYRRFWVETENRWVRLRVSNAALRLIDKIGIDAGPRRPARPRRSLTGARSWPKADAKRSSWNPRAGTGHFYTTNKNKKTTPEKLEIMKFDPKARKHVLYKETKLK